MLGNTSNPMLAQAEQGIQSKVPAKLQGALSKVVHAGLSIIYSPQVKGELQKRIASTSNPALEAGQGSARMLSTLWQQSQKSIPKPVMIPAAMIFAFEYLDLLSKAGKAQITPDLIAQTAQAVADAVLPMFGVSKDQLAKMIANKSGGVQSPASAPGIIGRAQQGSQ